jgi:hypothetical protein
MLGLHMIGMEMIGTFPNLLTCDKLESVPGSLD